MSDPQENKPSSQITLLLLIVAILAGGIFNLYAPLDTMRPSLYKKEFERSLGKEDVLSRMWQDPFQAVEIHKKGIEATKEKSMIFPYMFQPPEFVRDSENILILPVMISAERYAENFEARLQNRYALLSALHIGGYRPNDAEHIGCFEYAIINRKRAIPYEWFLPDPFPVDLLLHPQNSKKNKYDAVLVLWLGDEYFSGKQIEGLQDLFNHIRTPFQSISLSKEKTITVFDGGCFSDEQIKVFQNLYFPLLKLFQTSYIKEKTITVKVLGPNNSTSLKEIISLALSDCIPLNEFLKKMQDYLEASGENKIQIKNDFEIARIDLKKEIISPMPYCENKFEMYSPWATADPLLMLAKKPAAMSMLFKIYKELQSENILEEENIFTLILKHKKVGLQRSIHTDHELSKELVKELKRRGIDMKKENSGNIIIISDWDTFYGRALPTSFTISLLKDQEEMGKNRKSYNVKHIKKGQESLKKKIHTFCYMRGIDGYISAADASSGSQKSNPTGTEQITQNTFDTGYLTPSFKQPLGQSQYDYIRRLTSRVLHEFSKEKGKVSAIGVLGNDIYDKLLILRAMRSQFPNAIFLPQTWMPDFHITRNFPGRRTLLSHPVTGISYTLNGKGQFHHSVLSIKRLCLHQHFRH